MKIQEQMTEILDTEESLYDFLYQHYKANGVIDKTLLMPAVLERLFDENKLDSCTAELFGFTEKEINKIRIKYRNAWRKVATSIRKEEEIRTIVEELTDKERNALKEAVSVLYLNDSSDYINGLWDVVRAIVGEKVEDDDFSLEKWLNALDPEMGE